MYGVGRCVATGIFRHSDDGVLLRCSKVLTTKDHIVRHAVEQSSRHKVRPHSLPVISNRKSGSRTSTTVGVG